MLNSDTKTKKGKEEMFTFRQAVGIGEIDY